MRRVFNSLSLISKIVEFDFGNFFRAVSICQEQREEGEGDGGGQEEIEHDEEETGQRIAIVLHKDKKYHPTGSN